MEKATNIPNLFEVECPPEKIQTELRKYQTFKLTQLIERTFLVVPLSEGETVRKL